MWPAIMESLRWLHVSLLSNKLAELESNLSVVGGPGNDSYAIVSKRLIRHSHIISMALSNSVAQIYQCPSRCSPDKANITSLATH